MAAHRCCCGCGEEVVINLAPKGWQLTFDGCSVTLDPSIGSPHLACRSHYWIRHDCVIWVEQMVRLDRPAPDRKPRPKESASGIRSWWRRLTHPD
jgi:hypothetical protein